MVRARLGIPYQQRRSICSGPSGVPETPQPICFRSIVLVRRSRRRPIARIEAESGSRARRKLTSLRRNREQFIDRAEQFGIVERLGQCRVRLAARKQDAMGTSSRSAASRTMRSNEAPAAYRGSDSDQAPTAFRVRQALRVRAAASIAAMSRSCRSRKAGHGNFHEAQMLVIEQQLDLATCRDAIDEPALQRLLQ
ncbi:MAG: hypothetical protein QOC84_2036 [Bradyrhizobium sp.]|nr:hypothetical protein [Bradyrhizobium sp.]